MSNIFFELTKHNTDDQIDLKNYTVLAKSEHKQLDQIFQRGLIQANELVHYTELTILPEIDLDKFF